MSKFTVEDRGNCVIIYGALPIDWISRFNKMLPKKTLCSPQLAQMMGANFAFGLQADVDALIAEVRPQAERRARELTAGAGLSEAAQRWLGSGERGVSSNTIFTRLTGVAAMGYSPPDHPYDPDDFRRCRLLLEQCPELAERLPEMAKASKAWAGLVDVWDAICLTMDAETPEWRTEKRGSAPRTYELIKQAIGRK